MACGTAYYLGKPEKPAEYKENFLMPKSYTQTYPQLWWTGFLLILPI